MTRNILGAVGALCVLSGSAEAQPSKTQAQLHEVWRTAIKSAALPGEGCFTAKYPTTVWTKIACTKAPARPFLPAGGQPSSYVVGNGNDHAIETATPISSA